MSRSKGVCHQMGRAQERMPLMLLGMRLSIESMHECNTWHLACRMPAQRRSGIEC